jgi:DNA-binding IclR family transcriptional regulator
MTSTDQSDEKAINGLVKSADRVLLLLEYLAQVGEAPFASIVRDLDLPSSSTYQLLQTALRRGFIELDERARLFRLGLRLWEVAQSYTMPGNLVGLAQPLMDELVAITTETVQLARLDGLDNVYLGISESPHPMKLVSSVGARLPAHTTGVGKALLAGLPDKVLDDLLDGVVLASFTTRTITDHSTLRREIDRIRLRGYAEDNEEYVIGCRCTALPIRDSSGRTVAAMSVSVPTPRYSKSIARKAREALAVTVSRLEHRMSEVGSVS